MTAQTSQIFPIMHAVVIRKETLERDPALAPRLYAAFEAAKAPAWQRMNRAGTLADMPPWMIDDLVEIRHVFGSDPWPYAHPVPIDELFARRPS